jgi:hypothetical protein
MTAFTRAYVLTVGTVKMDASTGVAVNTLRIAFQVERDVKRVPNSAEFEITNLNEGHREALAKLHNVPVHLEAGYVGEMGTVFLGDLRSARTRKEGTEFITRVSSGDGESKIRTANISRTFPAGTPVGTVIAALGKALGAKTGNVSAFATAALSNGSTKLTRSLTIHGAVYDELEKFTTSCGLAWSIQDGAVQIRERGLPVRGTRGALLNATSGLVGNVEVEIATETKDGAIKGQPVVHGSCLLRTDVSPGQPAKIDSLAFSGNIVIVSTVHRGDTHAPDGWVVDWSGRPYA